MGADVGIRFPMDKKDGDIRLSKGFFDRKEPAPQFQTGDEKRQINSLTVHPDRNIGIEPSERYKNRSPFLDVIDHCLDRGKGTVCHHCFDIVRPG